MGTNPTLWSLELPCFLAKLLDLLSVASSWTALGSHLVGEQTGASLSIVISGRHLAMSYAFTALLRAVQGGLTLVPLSLGKMPIKICIA